MKIKVINKNTKEQFDCEEIEINGYKYYIIDTAVGCKYGISKLNEVVKIKIGYDATLYKGIICSNNPNIDVPKIVDEVKKLAKEYCEYWEFNRILGSGSNGLAHDSFISGYNKSQETHPFSEEDMIDFAEFYFREEFNSTMQDCKSSKEILRLWKEQKPKIVYYNE